MHRETLSDLLSLLLIAAVFVALLCWWRLPRPCPRLLQRAGLLIGAALVLEVTGLVLRVQGAQNNVLYNGFLVFEFGMMLWLIATAERGLQRPAALAGMVGVAGFVWSIMEQGGLHLLSTNAILIFCLLLAPLLVRLLYLQAQQSQLPLTRLGSFWFFLGSFLYFVGLVPLIGAVRLVYAHDRELAASLWLVIPVLAILRYAFYARACRLGPPALKP